MKKYRDLSEAERKLICNGCGGKGSIIPVPEFCFTASCNHHDYNYFLGGDESDRLKADRQFYEAMLHDAESFTGIRKRFYQFWAWTYYRAVRFRGHKYFNYKK